jgi:hypothetical protein
MRPAGEPSATPGNLATKHDIDNRDIGQPNKQRTGA